MSLINQMLKDIEKRSLQTEKKTFFISGLEAASSSIKYNLFNYWMLLCVIFLSLSVIFVFQKKIHYPANNAIQYSLIKNNLQEKQILPEKQLSKMMLDTPLVLTGITFQVQPNLTVLGFLLNQDVLYRINYDKKNNQLIIFLDHTRLLSTLPVINYQNSAIHDMRVLNLENGDLKIIVKLEDEIEIKELKWLERSKFPKLQLSLYHPDSTLEKNTSEISLSESTHHSIKKLVVNMTIQEHYDKALALLSVGATFQAKQMLQEIIIKYPEYHLARVSLAKIFLQEGDEKKAEKLLEAGMQLQPRYIPYIELKAKILADADKTQEALHLMQRLTPPLEENADYYAFIAALYQRQGNPRMAARMYEQLLHYNSNKAVWWVGLGIAFNGLNRHSEALEAFGKASKSDDLTPELNDYIGSQIQNS